MPKVQSSSLFIQLLTAIKISGLDKNLYSYRIDSGELKNDPAKRS